MNKFSIQKNVPKTTVVATRIINLASKTYPSSVKPSIICHVLVTSTQSIASNPVNSNQPHELPFNELDYHMSIIMPLIVGIFVALILSWMLIRYKMAANEASYNGSIYCCPQECFDLCAKFFECKFKFKFSLLKKREPRNRCEVPKNPQILLNNIKQTLNNSELEIINNKRNEKHRNEIDVTACSSNSSSVLQIPFINPEVLTGPFRFFRSNTPSRRESCANMPDLIRSNNFSTNLFHTFQFKNSTGLA